MVVVKVTNANVKLTLHPIQTWCDDAWPEGDGGLPHAPLIGGALPALQRTSVPSAGHAHQLRPAKQAGVLG